MNTVLYETCCNNRLKNHKKKTGRDSLAARPVPSAVCRLVGCKSACWLVVWLIVYLVGLFVCWLVCLVGWLLYTVPGKVIGRLLLDVLVVGTLGRLLFDD